MSRPYRHISTGVLVEQYETLQARVHDLYLRDYAILASSPKREMRKVAKELDRRRRNQTPIDPDHNLMGY